MAGRTRLADLRGAGVDLSASVTRRRQRLSTAAGSAAMPCAARATSDSRRPAEAQMAAHPDFVPECLSDTSACSTAASTECLRRHHAPCSYPRYTSGTTARLMTTSSHVMAVPHPGPTTPGSAAGDAASSATSRDGGQRESRHAGRCHRTDRRPATSRRIAAGATAVVMALLLVYWRLMARYCERQRRATPTYRRAASAQSGPLPRAALLLRTTERAAPLLADVSPTSWLRAHWLARRQGGLRV